MCSTERDCSVCCRLVCEQEEPEEVTHIFDPDDRDDEWEEDA